MWVLKLKTKAENQVLGNLSMKYQVSMSGYPLTYYKDKNHIYLTISGFIFGEEQNKKQFMNALKKSPAVVNLEMTNDFGIIVIKEPLSSEAIYNPNIIRICPDIINKDGFHIWTFASFDRNVLSNVLNISVEKLGGEVLKFQKEKINNISFSKALPELTLNQKRALEIAINNGYYDYPKKITMEKLAKLMKISYSTYQAHLRKAEKKLIPYSFEKS